MSFYINSRPRKLSDQRHNGALIKTSSKLIALALPLVLNFGCQRIECQKGMMMCSADWSAVMHCERGQWVQHEQCAEGLMCMEVTTETEGDHAGHGEVSGQSLKCVSHSDHSGDDHSHSSGEHSAGEHSAGEHSAGEHSAGEHSAGEHSAGEHSAGEHSAGEHSAGEHSAGMAGLPPEGE